MQTLGDLGERAIIDEVLGARYGAHGESFGDDCASVRVLPEGDCLYQVVTTDPCPVPAASILGFSDYYYWGWLLGTINISDLAAAGAQPSGFLSSLVLPSNFLLVDFVRLLDGLDECLALAGTKVIGGNLKEGRPLMLTGTALGWTDSPPMSRRGARPGDVVAVLGDLGSFWAGYLALSAQLELPATVLNSVSQNVLQPNANVELGLALRRSGLVTACMDNSDGLYPSLAALSKASDVQIHVCFDAWQLPGDVLAVAKALGIDGRRLGLGWGDWQLVVSINPERLEEVQEAALRLGSKVHVIGDVRAGFGVRATLEGVEGGLLGLDSQRFSPDSWFSAGIESYIQTMLESPLVKFERRKD